MDVFLINRYKRIAFSAFGSASSSFVIGTGRMRGWLGRGQTAPCSNPALRSSYASQTSSARARTPGRTDPSFGSSPTGPFETPQTRPLHRQPATQSS
jgi:hypothetical protein